MAAICERREDAPCRNVWLFAGTADRVFHGVGGNVARRTLQRVASLGRMDMGTEACSVARHYGVRVPGAVAISADWQARVTCGGDFRFPPGWRWELKLQERSDGLEEFAKRSADVEWCFRLVLFDVRALCGRPLPVTGEARGDTRAVMTAASLERGAYPSVPSCWEAYEVPWGLYAESPRTALVWGLELSANPFRAVQSARERGAMAHALWSATLSEWAQNVAAELLYEARSAWNGQESGDRGRLWWIPGALLRGMRDIGPLGLCGGDRPLSGKLEKLLEAITHVRWSAIDPCYIRRPRENRVGAPVYAWW
eukprot:IDg1147t1